MAETNDDPWLPLGIGIVVQIVGGVVIWLGDSTDTDTGLWLGWAAVGVGAVFLLVGLIALGVAIGIRSAKD